MAWERRQRMTITMGIGVAFLGVAIVLGLCAVTGIGMEHAYQNATPRVNPGDAALAFGAASAFALALSLFAAPKRVPLPVRILLSLCLFATAGWLSYAVWIWAFMVG